MSEIGALTPVSVLAEAERLLRSAGYVLKREGLEKLGLPTDRCFLAEDAYGIALVAAYASWPELESSWKELQDNFVDAVSLRITRGNPKAWDAYLVLLVPAEMSPEHEREAGRIRQDTTRTRKLISAGDELRTLLDVDRAISPLLPIGVESHLDDETSDPLSSLPSMLQGRGVDPHAVDVIVDAFRSHKPLLDELHRYLTR